MKKKKNPIICDYCRINVAVDENPVITSKHYCGSCLAEKNMKTTTEVKKNWLVHRDLEQVNKMTVFYDHEYMSGLQYLKNIGMIKVDDDLINTDDSYT